MAPSACSRISAAVNETLCPPTNTKISGHRRLVSLARSTITGDVGEVIARKRDHVGPPVVDRPQVTVQSFDLEIEQPDLMPGLTRRLRPTPGQAAQAEEDLGVH